MISDQVFYCHFRSPRTPIAVVTQGLKSNNHYLMINAFGKEVPSVDRSVNSSLLWS